MTRRRLGVCLAAIVCLFARPAAAHHSFGAEFDANKPVTLKGVVTKVEWTNPHSHFALEVKDVTMKAGDTVTIFGWRARDGSNSAHAREVTFADGKKLFYGPPAGTGEGGNTPAVKVP